MEIILIAAMAANQVIGRSQTNDIPWEIPGEQRFFKETTMGHALIMGRKTYESIGFPLPGRRSLVITRDPTYKAPGCLVVGSLDQALAAASLEKKAFVIGGAQIFTQAIGQAQAIILSVLERPFDGDILFPEIPDDFKEIKRQPVAGLEPYNITTYQRCGQTTPGNTK